MKKKILLLITVGFLLSCNNDEQDNADAKLVGNWKLIEVLADIGDGKGTFQPVESNKTIEFKNNGIIATNSSLCDTYSNEIINTGSYDRSNKTITTGCTGENIAIIQYELENQYLILNYYSIEGYSQKYQKIN